MIQEIELATKRCTMCGREAEYIATETNEYLCKECGQINQDIKSRDYPDKDTKHPLKKIELEENANQIND